MDARSLCKLHTTQRSVLPSSRLLLDVHAVELRIDGRDILRDVTLRTDARRVAVVGRNGSGKSTLARVTAGLQTPDSGSVHIAGVDVAHDRRSALSTVGILFQNPDHQIIFPTVEEELGFGLSQMGMNKPDVAEQVTQTLTRFGKQDWAEVAVHRLSQGQRQLLCLMAIMAMAPKVILLDEPFAGLDIPTARHLSRVLAQTEAALVHITHDPAMVADYDHVLWIEAGRVAQQGAADDVLSAFTTTMEQLGARDDLTDITG